MEEKEARWKLVKEGLRGYLLALNALKAFEQEIQATAKRVLVSCVPKIKDAGCQIDPVATYPHQQTVDGAMALGCLLTTSTSEKDSHLRWSAIYCGVAWACADDNPNELLSFACCELRVEGAGRRETLFTSLSKARSRSGELISDTAVLTKLSTQNGVQVRIRLSPDMALEEIEKLLYEAVEITVALLAAAGGLRKAILGQ